MGLFSRSPASAQSPKTESKMKRLTLNPARHRQSKLERDKLEELEKATHFDKKELQQWYKGVLPIPVPFLLSPTTPLNTTARRRQRLHALTNAALSAHRKRSLCALVANQIFRSIDDL